MACAECNRLRQRDDDKITRTKKQLKKFCKLHHLPTLITDENEYYNLKENITGVFSNVLHFNSVDTDSLYMSIAGDMNKPIDQLFDYAIKNKIFHDKHIYCFMPNPSINNVNDEKKILGCCVEKFGRNQVALAANMYTIWTDDKTISLKLKGVSLKKNNIKSSEYKEIIEKQTIMKGKNINLQMNNQLMSKITVIKNALTMMHNKMITLSNHCYCPYIHGMNASSYFIENH